MKVLWFSNTPASGSEYINHKMSGGGWLEALDNVMQNKVELHIAFHYPKGLKPFNYGQSHYYPVTAENWRLHMIKNVVFNVVYDREFETDYLRLVDKIHPDIIHIHGTENPFGCIIGKINIPVVVSVQGNITVYTHKYLNGLGDKYLKERNINLNQLLKSLFITKSFGSGYKKFKKMTRIEARNIANCKFIIGRTDWDRRIVSVLAPNAKYFHGDELLRDQFYNSIWTKKGEGSLLIHSTSGNGYYKGFETICQCLNLLNKNGISVNWKVAGIKESDLIVKLVRKELGKSFPQKGLLLQGTLDENELISRMLEADIFISASHIENSPNSLCEAMILGMPCIATFAGGTGSMLKDGEEGILIQDGDPWAMAGAILELSKDREKAIRFGQNARKRALVRHDKNRNVSALINIYQEILNKK